MNQRAERPSQKRLQILDADELEALYGRPRFTPDDRLQYFTLTPPEHDARALLRSVPSQLYFMLQLAYFKAKQLFSPLPLLRSPMMLPTCSLTLTLIRGLFGHFATRFLIKSEVARHQTPVYEPILARAPHSAERACAEHRFCGEDQLISGRFLASDGEPKFVIRSMTHREPFSNPELEFWSRRARPLLRAAE